MPQTRSYEQSASGFPLRRQGVGAAGAAVRYDIPTAPTSWQPWTAATKRYQLFARQSAELKYAAHIGRTRLDFTVKRKKLSPRTEGRRDSTDEVCASAERLDSVRISGITDPFLTSSQLVDRLVPFDSCKTGARQKSAKAARSGIWPKSERH